MLGVARMVVPLFADARDIHQPRCVVSLDQLGVFARNVECLRHAPRERLIGLRLEPVEALGDVALADDPTPLVKLGQQAAPVVESRRIDGQLHVALEVPVATRRKRRIGRAQRPGAVEPAEIHERRLSGTVDRAWEQRQVARHAIARIVRARDAGVVRADVRPGRVALADDRLRVVRIALRGERAHDGKLVRQPGQPLHRAAKRDARNRRRDFAGHRADAGWRAHLGVERLVLRRPAVLEQKHDALVPGQTAGLFDGFLRPEQVRQRQAAQSQASHREKLAPAPMVGSQPQHNS